MPDKKTDQPKDEAHADETVAGKNAKIDKLKFEVGQEMGIIAKQKYNK